MNENSQEIFLTSVSTTDKQLESMEINYDDNDDMNADIKSTTDSDGSIRAKTEIEQILSKSTINEHSSMLISKVESVNDVTETQMSMINPSTSAVEEPVEVVIPKSIYNYAAMVHQKLESPRQNKLEHDITTVLGTSDPPPGFGFLHPRFYYLEQKRPIPLEPLQVWRGYNGHVYFSPIQVQSIETDRPKSPKKKLESKTTQSVPLISRSNTILSLARNRLTAKSTNAKLKSHSTDLPVQRSVSFLDDEQPSKPPMWQSVVTCAHVRVKPISKRSQHAIEDLQALQQEQSIQDPTGYNRQVLPNIRPVPKSKFVYKGLAYKESQKLPGIINENDDDGNPLEKPLVAYNLAQAYARYEINAARSKHSLAQPPPSAATAAVIKEQTRDFRDIRKRIIRGTTLAYRPPTQSMTWTPGRADYRSTLGSETTLRRPSTSKSSIPQKQTTVDMSLVTKNPQQPRTSSRYTHTTEIIAT